MTRWIAPAGLAAGIALAAACTDPPSFRPERFDPIPGIRPGDTPEQVREILQGDPVEREDGFWRDGNRFEMDLQVWRYRGVGRVIFRRRDMRVVTSEHDPRG